MFEVSAHHHGGGLVAGVDHGRRDGRGGGQQGLGPGTGTTVSRDPPRIDLAGVGDGGSGRTARADRGDGVGAEAREGEAADGGTVGLGGGGRAVGALAVGLVAPAEHQASWRSGEDHAGRRRPAGPPCRWSASWRRAGRGWAPVRRRLLHHGCRHRSGRRRCRPTATWRRSALRRCPRHPRWRSTPACRRPMPQSRAPGSRGAVSGVPLPAGLSVVVVAPRIQVAVVEERQREACGTSVPPWSSWTTFWPAGGKLGILVGAAVTVVGVVARPRPVWPPPSEPQL